MSPSKNLLTFLKDLLLDPAEQAAFHDAPEHYLADHGFDGLSSADIADALPLVAETLPPAVAANVVPAADGPEVVGFDLGVDRPVGVLETLREVTSAHDVLPPVDEGIDGAAAAGGWGAIGDTDAVAFGGEAANISGRAVGLDADPLDPALLDLDPQQPLDAFGEPLGGPASAFDAAADPAEADLPEHDLTEDALTEPALAADGAAGDPLEEAFDLLEPGTGDALDEVDDDFGAAANGILDRATPIGDDGDPEVGTLDPTTHGLADRAVDLDPAVDALDPIAHPELPDEAVDLATTDPGDALDAAGSDLGFDGLE